MPGEEVVQSSSNNEKSAENTVQSLETDASQQKDTYDLISSEVTSNANSGDLKSEVSSMVVELPTSQNLTESESDQLENSNSGVKMPESVDESLLESVNTLDDISSLKTAEEDCSITLNDLNEEKETDIGQIETKLTPSSLKEPLDNVKGDATNGDEEEETEDGWIDVIGSGDLMKKIIRKGAGVDTRPVRGNLVCIRVIGRLENGETVEDEKKKKIIIGDAEVIQGLDLTIPLMELNEVSEIIVKPRLAYGSIGKDPEIPPNATVNYEIELLAVEDEPEPEKMSFADRKVIGDQKRDRGNFWYSRGEYSCALQCYRRALDFLDDASSNFSEITEEQRELAAMWMKVSNNMAAAQLKIGAYDAALKSVENVLKVQPKNVKALYRKGKILSSNGNTEEAVRVMKNALDIEPENKIIQQELANVISRFKSEKQSERDMYRRMLGQDKQSPQSMTQAEDSSRKFLKWGLIIGAVTAAIASIAAYRHFHSGANY